MGTNILKHYLEQLAKRGEKVFSFMSLENCVLLIDGSNVLHEFGKRGIHPRNSIYGGDYDQLEAEVSGFCSSLKQTKTEPVFLFDGASRKGSLEFRKKRLREKISAVRNTGLDGKSRHFRPCLAMKTLIDTLRSLDVKFCVVDGYADPLLAGLAKFWECPILSGDGGFLLYDLPGGVIFPSYEVMSYGVASPTPEVLKHVPMPRETKIWQVYKRENLAKFYQLPDTDMLLILPTICTSKQDGYALRLKEHYRDLIMGLQWPGHSDQKDDSNYIFKWLSKYKTFEEALNAIVEWGSCSDELRTEIMEGILSYRTLPPIDCIDEYFATRKIFYDSTNPPYVHLPEEFWRRYRSGLIDSCLLTVIVSHTRFFYTQMEDLTQSSSWKCSKHIRELSYKILSSSLPEPILTVEEWDRNGELVETTSVEVPEAEKDFSLHHLYSLTPETRLKIFYDQLGLNEADDKQLVTDDNILGAAAVSCIRHASANVLKRHWLPLLLCIADMEMVTSKIRDLQSTESMGTNESRTDMRIVHFLSQFQTVLHDTLDLLALLAIEHKVTVSKTINGSIYYKLVCLMDEDSSLPDMLLDNMKWSARARFERLEQYVSVHIERSDALQGPSPSIKLKPKSKVAVNRRASPPSQPSADDMASQHECSVQTRNRFFLLEDNAI